MRAPVFRDAISHGNQRDGDPNATRNVCFARTSKPRRAPVVHCMLAAVETTLRPSK
jgi:hypothetical protein